MAETTLRMVLRIATDCLCLVIVCLPTLIVKYDSSLQPYHRGFYCDDESIMKPLRISTVRWKYAIATAVLLPAVLISIVELIHYIYNPARALLPKYQMGPVKVNHYLWTVYRFVGVYYFGLAVCMSFKDIGKMTVGRLRPHFLAVCKPDYSKVNCSWYVENDVCTGDPDKILEARLSFPSGHSSLAFFAMTYTAMYLQCRMQWKSTMILRHALQAVLLWMSWFTALSRISDYKHHWSDVLAGSLLGVTAAALTVQYVAERFRVPGDADNSTHDSIRHSVEASSRKISSSSRPSRKVSKASMSNMPTAHGSTELGLVVSS